MFDILAIIILVTIIILVCILVYRIKIFTSITLGFVIGWICSGLLIQHRDFYDDFDSTRMAERRMLYHLFSTLAVLFLIIHIFMTTYRELKLNKIK